MTNVSKYVQISGTSLTIVFVRSVNELKSYKAGLENLPELTGRIEIYHGGLNSQQRLIAASSWSSGRKPLMIATTAFSHGVHDDKCRRVIHVGMPFDIDTYVQAAGRSGRDGAESKSVILLDNRPSNMRSDFQAFLKTDRCRLAALSSLLDTSDLQWHGTCGRCDKCLAKGSVAQMISPEWRRETCSQYCSNCDIELSEQQKQARQFISRTKSAISKLLSLCKQKTCFTCYALTNGRDKKIHAIEKCPHWRGRCFRCGSKGCSRKSCDKSRYILDKLTQANLCITCSLPPRMFDSPVHAEQGSMGKSCSYRDTVLPLMLLMWQDQSSLRRIQAHASQSFATFDAYISWALEDVGGVSRFRHFLVGHLGLST
jgi:superfamily II DNA helicase RecQ